jgi:hypothetical protein
MNYKKFLGSQGDGWHRSIRKAAVDRLTDCRIKTLGQGRGVCLPLNPIHGAGSVLREQVASAANCRPRSVLGSSQNNTSYFATLSGARHDDLWSERSGLAQNWENETIYA